MVLYGLQRKLIYFPDKTPATLPPQAERPENTLWEEVRTTTTDQIVLHGWHVRPDRASQDARATGRVPLVLYFPGNAGHRGWRIDTISQLVSAGVAVLIFDYRGYGGNAGHPHEAGLEKDAQAVWAFATKTLHYQPSSIYLYGESLGGGVAVALAHQLEQAGHPPAGLLLQATFDSLVAVAAVHFPLLPVRWLLRDRYPSVQRIPEIHCRLVCLHGTRDSIVPIEHGRRLFDAAPAVSRDGFAKRWITTDSDHNDIPPEALSSALAVLIAPQTPPPDPYDVRSAP